MATRGEPCPPTAGRAGAVPALRRGLAVLQFLASRPAPVSATAVARELGLARSSVYELLTELAAAGFVTHVAHERRWGLGVAAFEIGSAYLRGQPLERMGAPVLQWLAAAGAAGTGGGSVTAHLGVLHGNQMLYLLRQRAGRAGPAVVTDVGVRLPAPLTATGLSLLAGLPPAQLLALFPGPASFVDRTGTGPRTLPELRAELARVRRRGWATEHGRVSEALASVAAAAVDHQGRPLAAVGLTVPHRCSGRQGDERECDGAAALDECAGLVVEAAARLTAAVGGVRSAGRPPVGR